MPKVNLPATTNAQAVGKPKTFMNLKDRMAQRAQQRTSDVVMTLLDLSGSMGIAFPKSTDRLAAAKNAICKFLDSCNPQMCSVGLITFESDVRLRIEPITHYESLKFELGKLRTGGMTLLGGAIKMFNELTLPKRAIIVSDGEPGDDWESEVTISVALKRTIDCIFIGELGGHGEKTLRTIAERTGGIFYTVDDLDKFQKAMVSLTTENRLMLTKE